jgi:putative transposase
MANHTPARRKRIRLHPEVYVQGNAFSITIATFERYPWFRTYASLAAEAVQCITDLEAERESLLFAWCVMPDHVHLLLHDRDVIHFVRLLKGKLIPGARQLENGRSLWQRSFYDHALRKEEALADVARYIWENPVRAGIVERALEYPWSGSLVWNHWREIFQEGTKPAPTRSS